MEAQTFTQNNLELTYTPDKIKKGTSVGNPILRPVLSDKDLKFRIDWLGGDAVVLKLLDRIINADAAEASREAYDEKSGSFDVNKWREVLSGTNTAAETLDELRDRLQETKDNQLALVMSDDFDKSNPEQMGKLKALQADRLALEKVIADKEEANARRVANRKANEAAKAAAEANAGSVAA